MNQKVPRTLALCIVPMRVISVVLACAVAAAATTAVHAAVGDTTDLRFATFNTFLLDEADDRKAAIIEDLGAAAETTDVICLQEVWDDLDMREIATALQDEYPYTAAWVNPNDSEPTMESPACQLTDLLSLVQCTDKCPDEMDAFEDATELPDSMSSAGDVDYAALDEQLIADILNCMIEECNDFMVAMVQKNACYNCVTTSLLGGGDPQDCAFTGSKSRRWDNGFGTMIMSKHPLMYERRIQLPVYLGQRATIYAEIQPIEDADRIGIACNHLTSILSTTPYIGEHGSWEAENMRDTELIIDEIVNWEYTPPNLVVLGDLNHGIAVEVDGHSIHAEAPDAYHRLLDSDDFTNLYMQEVQADGATYERSPCTWCNGENPLVPEDNSPSSIIDHVLVRGEGMEVLSTERIFDRLDAATVLLPESGDGEEPTLVSTFVLR